MSFRPEYAAIRFGEGLSPDVRPPASVEVVLDRLRGRDTAAEAFPIAQFSTLRPQMQKLAELRRAYRRGRDGG